jgi:hypothetical protein
LGSRVHLPSLGLGAVRIPAGPPSVDDARAALGGRASTDAGAGALVRLGATEGVVVFASATERDVWIGEGRFQRVATATCVPSDGASRPDLTPVASDARRFAALAEGDAVRVRDRSDREQDGRLIEKCRYGALVLCEEERVIAVSFRRIHARE